MFLRTLVVWAIGITVTFMLFPFAVFSFLIDRSGNSVHLIARLWSGILLFLSGARVEVKGVENIPRGPAVFISNHRGAFDIPVLQTRLPIQFRWVATKGLFKIPIVGWAMSLAGYIAMDRQNSEDAVKTIEKAAGKIKGGMPVLVFPEGTRNESEKLLSFKRGAFILAVKSSAPIVPVAIKGTEAIMKRGSVVIHPASVRVSIGKPIEVDGFSENELRKITKEAIERGLSSI